MRDSFFMGAGRKKGKLRVLRGYPQSFFICRTYPCICCLYPFGAHSTPSGTRYPFGAHKYPFGYTIPLRGTQYPFGYTIPLRVHNTPSGHTVPLRAHNTSLGASSLEIVCAKEETPSLRCAPISYCKRFFLAKANQRNLCDPPRFFKADPFIFYSSIR